VCPAARIQTVSVEQGPWQRKLGLASVHTHMAGGESVVAAHRTNAEAAIVASHLYAASTHPAA
jgi:putative membrane protein